MAKKTEAASEDSAMREFLTREASSPGERQGLSPPVLPNPP